jgi:hypothetical protein
MEEKSNASRGEGLGSISDFPRKSQTPPAMEVYLLHQLTTLVFISELFKIDWFDKTSAPVLSC